MSDPSSPAPLRGLLFICLAAVAWGTTGAVTTVLVTGTGAPPLLIGAVRLLLAAAVLLGLARAVGPLGVARRDAWRCAALGACMAGFQATYFTAVTMIGIALTALIAICGAPLLIAGLAAAVLGERLTPRVAAALGLGIAGTALLVVGPRTGADVSAPFVAGVLLALGASLSYALYVVIAKSLLARTPPLPMAGIAFAVGAALLAPALAWPDAGRQIALGWPWLLFLGVVATGGAYAIYTIGLREVSASVAGVGGLLEPLTATLLGVVFFGERLGPPGIAGALLLLTALTLLLTAPTPPRGSIEGRSVEEGRPPT